MFKSFLYLVVLLHDATISVATSNTICLYKDERVKARAIAMDFSELLKIKTDEQWNNYYQDNIATITGRLELLDASKELDESQIRDSIRAVLAEPVRREESSSLLHLKTEDGTQEGNEGKKKAYTYMLMNTAFSLDLLRGQQPSAFETLMKLAADPTSLLQEGGGAFDWTAAIGVPMFTKWMIILYGMKAEVLGKFENITTDNAAKLVCYLDQTHLKSIDRYLENLPSGADFGSSSLPKEGLKTEVCDEQFDNWRSSWAQYGGFTPQSWLDLWRPSEKSPKQGLSFRM
jgi:hypothetical protein